MTSAYAGGMFRSSEALAAMRLAARRAAADAPPPANVVAWLARLRLLAGVPFEYLVVDSRLLPPPESIRFFYVDRNWTDAACDGALNIAAGVKERAHLRARSAALREAVDVAERNLRHTQVHPDETLEGDADTPLTGFLLRSRLVSGWPGLQVRATSGPAATPVRLARMERLAPAVLLVMFDGIPDVVTIEEPHQGIQFGFDANGDGYEIPARNGQPAAGPVPFRPGAPGVVDVTALAQLLGVGESASLARRLMQFPFSQDFSVVPDPTSDVVFQPSIAIADLNAALEGGP